MYNYYLSKDIFDSRDFIFKTNINAGNLPKLIDLRNLCPAVYDQGEEGSCTANAGAAAREMLYAKSNLELSRAFLYYEERNLEGTTTEDSGATLRDCCSAMKLYGICEEQYMPYLTTPISQAPSSSAVKNAFNYKITSYKRLNSLTDVKISLSTDKKPVIIGMAVFESMESENVKNTGILPMPEFTEQELGGHAVLIVGYDDTKKYLIVRNSWGNAWGDKGYFYMSYDYFNKYVFDKWILS